MPNRAIRPLRLLDVATTAGSILVPTLLAALLTGTMMLALGCSGAPPPAPPPAVRPPPQPPGPTVLSPGEGIDRRLGGTEPDLFRLPAETGWFLKLEIAALSPVRVRLLAPSGREVGAVETLRGSKGTQAVTMLADESGDYRLEVTAREGAPSGVAYRLKAREVRPAQAGDRERTEAEKALAESRRLARLENEPSFRLALEAAQRALGLWESAGDAEGTDRARLDAAGLEQQLGRLGEARSLAQQARDGAHGRGDARLEALALLTLGEIVLAGGDPVQAWASLEPASTLWTNLASPRELGRTMLAQGLAFPPGEARARSLLEGALEPLRQAGDADGEARALGALQPVLAAQGQEAEGRKALEDAIRTAGSGGTRTAQSTLFAQRAALDRRAGNVAAALAGYQRAAALDRVLGLHLRGLGSLAAVCLAQRDLDEDDEARICYGQLLKESQGIGDTARESEAMLELAEVALRQGRSKDALAFLDRLALALRPVPEEGQRPFRPRIVRDSGIAKRNAGLAAAGLADLTSALTLLSQGDSADQRAERAQIQIQIGVTAQRMGDVEAAKAAFQAATALASGAGLVRERRRSLFGEASVAFAQRDLETARAGIEEALALDAQAGPLAPWERTLPDAESGRHAFYELEVELLMRLQYQASGHAPDAGYAERAFELATTARAIDGEVRSVPRAAIEAGLGDDEALLHYFVGQERSYLFLLTRGSLRTFEVPIRLRELAAKVQRLRSVLASPQATPRPFLMEAVPLFEVLLGPAESALAGKAKWIVSAEGPLLTLPFEVLPTDAKESRGKGFADLPYVLRGHTVSYRPWPAALPGAPAAGSIGSIESKTFIAFAAPLPKALAPPAPRYREEVEEIAARYPASATEVYLGGDATEQRAEGNPVYAAARRIHFAASSLLDSSHPERSGIALTPATDPSSADDDGLLDTEEIAAQPLRAELVVLPLCRTVRGREVGGEGGFALARAFQHAGARAVLLDLWPLPEAAASGLIPSLYPLLDAGATPAEALRAAKLALLQGGAADPMYWAPFVLLDAPASRP